MMSGFTTQPTFGCLGPTYDRLRGRQLFQAVRYANLSQTALGIMNPHFAGFWQRMNIENKTVLVTGSTDGVGRLVACRLADQGARVLIHGRDRTRGEQLLKEIGAANRGSHPGPFAAVIPADCGESATGRGPHDPKKSSDDRDAPLTKRVPYKPYAGKPHVPSR